MVNIIKVENIPIILSFLTCLEVSLFPPLPLSPDNPDPFSVTVILSFLEVYINGIIRYVTSSVSGF